MRCSRNTINNTVRALIDCCEWWVNWAHQATLSIYGLCARYNMWNDSISQSKRSYDVIWIKACARFFFLSVPPRLAAVIRMILVPVRRFFFSFSFFLFGASVVQEMRVSADKLEEIEGKIRKAQALVHSCKEANVAAQQAHGASVPSLPPLKWFSHYYR